MGGRRARARWAVAAALLGVVVAVVVVVLATGSSAPRPPAPAAAAPARIQAADGTALDAVPGMAELAARLAVVHPPDAARGPVRTAVEPDLQRTLLAALPAGAAAGVVVDVATGRVRAAGGTHGASPWRTTVAPGAVVEPALAAAAIDVGDVQPAAAARALDPDDDAAARSLAVRTSAAGVQDVLRRAGLQTPARAADLAGFARPGDVPALGVQLTEGVGRAAAFRDADGSYRDVQRLARASPVGLAQLALAVAGGGRRRDLGVTRPGPEPLEPLWSAGAAGAVTRALAARVRAGEVPGLGGGAIPIAGTSDDVPTGTSGRSAATLVAWAPVRRPRAVVALVATGRTASPRRLGVAARVTLAAALLEAERPGSGAQEP